MGKRMDARTIQGGNGGMLFSSNIPVLLIIAAHTSIGSTSKGEQFSNIGKGLC